MLGQLDLVHRPAEVTVIGVSARQRVETGIGQQHTVGRWPHHNRRRNGSSAGAARIAG